MDVDVDSLFAAFTQPALPEDHLEYTGNISTKEKKRDASVKTSAKKRSRSPLDTGSNGTLVPSSITPSQTHLPLITQHKRIAHDKPNRKLPQC